MQDKADSNIKSGEREKEKLRAKIKNEISLRGPCPTSGGSQLDGKINGKKSQRNNSRYFLELNDWNFQFRKDSSSASKVSEEDPPQGV